VCVCVRIITHIVIISGIVPRANLYSVLCKSFSESDSLSSGYPKKYFETSTTYMNTRMHTMVTGKVETAGYHVERSPPQTARCRCTSDVTKRNIVMFVNLRRSKYVRWLFNYLRRYYYF